jgi:hypothetical protein
MLRRRGGSGPRGGGPERQAGRRRGGQTACRRELPGPGDRVRPGVSLPDRPAAGLENGAAVDPADCGARGIGGDRGGADRDLSPGNARRLAADRPDAAAPVSGPGRAAGAPAHGRPREVPRDRPPGICPAQAEAPPARAAPGAR